MNPGVFRRGRGFLALLAATVAPPAAALDISGSAALTSDYVLRGISQTQGDPALQLGLRGSAANGFYAAVWASQVDFPGLDTDAEVDLSAGWSGALNPRWSLDLNLTRYLYTGSGAGPGLDYNELIATLTYAQRGCVLTQ